MLDAFNVFAALDRWASMRDAFKVFVALDPMLDAFDVFAVLDRCAMLLMSLWRWTDRAPP